MTAPVAARGSERLHLRCENHPRERGFSGDFNASVNTVA